MSDKKLGFVENFMLSGVAAGVSKTVAAPIERVKLSLTALLGFSRQRVYAHSGEVKCDP